MEYLNLSIADIIPLSVLLICLIFQLVYYWVYLFKPYKYQSLQAKDEVISSSLAPVSVIMTGRNEAQNLETYLPSILEQNYSEYEIIFVNDASTDDTEDVLKRFASRYPHLYHTYIPAGSKNLSRKKLALTVGIKAAKYDILLFTEPASCPVSSDWISQMSARFTDKKKIVLGFSFLNKYPSKYISYDYYWGNLQMTSLALMNLPYSGNGHNLAYSKLYFEEKKGFAPSNFLDAGEDDLFINQVATPTNVAVELSPNSHIAVDMAEKRLWREFKIHRTITRKFYK
ncbi:MAG: glycosyltransferase, partial [Bacteroidales bacterium]|nr:glycosyltransferase [Bacteroidales bacterium]